MPHVRIPAAVTAVVTLAAASVAGAVVPAVAADTVLTFGFTGSEQSFVVPAGVTSVGVIATGAPGEQGEDYRFPGDGGPGGAGARVSAVVPVTPGQVLYVRVGGHGTTGGWNGGSAGGPGVVAFGDDGGDGGTGGGATDLRTCSADAPSCPQGGTSLQSRLVVAAGGGGGGGGNGGQPDLPAGTGGSGAAAAGADGTDSLSGFGGFGAEGGQADRAGTGGAGNNGQQAGGAGSGAVGGIGGSGGGNPGGGGGGGGGWFGGGGGGAGFGGGGGGAGSSRGPAGATFAADASGTPSLAVYLARPEVTTGPPVAVTTESADLTGTVDPQAQPTTWWFEYGRVGGTVQRTPALDAGSGVGPQDVAATANGLAPGTTYTVRLVAENAIGRTVAEQRLVTTTAVDGPAAPSVTTGVASDVSTTAATVSGQADPRGQSGTWWFEYGVDSGVVRTAPEPAGPVGPDAASVSLRLADLQPGTRYEYRLVVATAGGTREGVFRAFTTAAAPASGGGAVPPQESAPAPTAADQAATPKVGVRASGLPTRVRVGDRASLRLVVTNTGTAPAESVSLRVSLTRRLEPRGSVRGCRVTGSTLTCTLPDSVAPGDRSVLRVPVRAVRSGQVAVAVRVIAPQ